MHPCSLDLKYGERMAKSQVEVSKTARKGAPRAPHDTGAIVLEHELAITFDEVEEVLGDRYDLHPLRPFIRNGARIAAGPYRWTIFYALRHPVAHGG